MAKDTLQIVTSESGFPTIAGVLTNRDTKQSVRGLLTLQPLGIHTRTDSLGRFHFDSLPAGPYTLVARALGFERDSQKVDLHSAHGVQIRFPLTPAYFDRCMEMKRVRQ